MLRYFYRDTIQHFLHKSSYEIFGETASNNGFALTIEQKAAWQSQIKILKDALAETEGEIFFEFSIPRMGKRVDNILIIQDVVFVIEFKIGEFNFQNHQIEQVWDYALDLKNFHQPSHSVYLVPLLVATEAKDIRFQIQTTTHDDNLLLPVCTNSTNLKEAINQCLIFCSKGKKINGENYANGSYHPTPTIKT